MAASVLGEKAMAKSKFALFFNNTVSTAVLFVLPCEHSISIPNRIWTSFLILFPTNFGTNFIHSQLDLAHRDIFTPN